jgi:two-component system sensor histidine kinase HupT/HoxJ
MERDTSPPGEPPPATGRARTPPARRETPPEGVGEDVWIDVIRKMDEVYSDLLQYEVALEEKNAALEESQKFIFGVLSSMSDVLVVCDRDGIVEEVNRALAELVGRDEAELRGAPLASLFADAAARERVEAFMRDPAAAHAHDCELQFRTRHGATPVAVNCTRRLSPSGRFVGIVMAGRPVGELRRAYDELRKAHDDLKRAQHQLVHAEKMASLGRLVAGVAHELNNPLSFVLGNVHALKRYVGRLRRYLDALHEGAAPDELAALRGSLRVDRILADVGPLIDGLHEGAERSRDIVAGLRRFSAADRGEDAVFDLAEVVRRSVHWVVRASASAIEVAIDLPVPLPVRGSAGQMQQVVVNLVQNAVDATEGRAGAALEIRGRGDATSVEVAFRDNGSGFSTEGLARAFEPFFTTKPPGKGTGLGLSISYGLAQRHGGSLAAANDPRGGAVMTLTLPRAADVDDPSPGGAAAGGL